jgi:hypothetical protein
MPICVVQCSVRRNFEERSRTWKRVSIKITIENNFRAEGELIFKQKWNHQKNHKKNHALKISKCKEK